MSNPLLLHKWFEDALFEAFPLHPIPDAEEIQRGAVGASALADAAFYSGKTWPETVGVRYPGVNDSPSLWLQSHAPNVIAYFLPGRLLFASFMLFSSETLSDRPAEMTELFFMPDLLSRAHADDVADTMFYTSDLWAAMDAKNRLFNWLDMPQRKCVAAYLRLYLMHRVGEFTQDARELYESNVLKWERGGAPGCT